MTITYKLSDGDKANVFNQYFSSVSVIIPPPTVVAGGIIFYC